MCNGSRPVYRVVTGIAPPYVMYDRGSGAFYGYCIDLLNAIGSMAGFDYTIRESNFDQHQDYREPDTDRWNGMIHELTKNMSEIAVGPIWITSSRAKIVDFTVPYQGASGFAIIMLKKRKEVPFLRFLTILEIEVWIGLALAFLLTVFLLFILERYSPFSYRNNREKYRDEADDRFCTLKECSWFVFTSITPQGGGDVPKNFSGKMVAVTWWLFAFVIAAAYTANLAAYATLDRFERNIESLEDLRKQYRVRYSTVLDSPAHRYFYRMKRLEETFHGRGTQMANICRRIWRRTTLDKNTAEHERSEYVVWDYPLEDKFTRMYLAMEETGFVPSVERATKMVRNVNRTHEFAFIAEARIVKYLLLTSCDLKQVGREFARKPFAFAVQKSSPLKRIIDDAITRLAIEGSVRRLEKKWWDENPLRASCPPDSEPNAGFGLDNLAVTFLLILLGVSLTVLILTYQYCRYCWQLNERAG